MAYVYPGPTNTWIPNWEATGQIIAYVRNPRQFPINEYVCFRPASKMVGVYLKLQSGDFVRVVNDDDYHFPDGGERPSGNENLLGFQFPEYRCKRRDFPVTLGNLTVEQADWPILAYHAQMIMSQAMVSLTRRIGTVLEATANWGSNFGTATALGGGLWSSAGATASTAYIRKTFDQVVQNIVQNTNGAASPDDIVCRIGVGGAKTIVETDEYRDYLKQSPFAMAEVRGDAPNKNKMFGLPNRLYGVEMVVENSVVEPTRGGATSGLAYIADSNKAVFMLKKEGMKGDLVGEEGKQAPNFSTFQVFYFGEGGTKTDETGAGLCVLETWNDVRNKRVEHHVVQNTAEVMVANESGYLVTNISS